MYGASLVALFTFKHWRRKWQPTPVCLPEKSMDRGVWQATVHRGHMSWI